MLATSVSRAKAPSQRQPACLGPKHLAKEVTALSSKQSNGGLEVSHLLHALKNST